MHSIRRRCGSAQSRPDGRSFRYNRAMGRALMSPCQTAVERIGNAKKGDPIWIPVEVVLAIQHGRNLSAALRAIILLKLLRNGRRVARQSL